MILSGAMINHIEFRVLHHPDKITAGKFPVFIFEGYDQGCHEERQSCRKSRSLRTKIANPEHLTT